MLSTKFVVALVFFAAGVSITTVLYALAFGNVLLAVINFCFGTACLVLGYYNLKQLKEMCFE